MGRFPGAGFTLVELLVVIAVIAVLASLLLPALARAHEKGRQAVCINNVRQQALAIFMYADDGSVILPPTAFASTNDTTITWPILLDPYLSRMPSGSRIHWCPSDENSRTNSYGLNELAFVDLTDPDSQAPNRLAQFKSPATTIMLGDLGTADDFKTVRPDTTKMVAPEGDLNDDEDARPAIRHSSRCDLEFIDGHMEKLRFEQFYKNQSPANRWFTP